MKVLFLDIDGVLNSTRSAVALHGYPRVYAVEDGSCFDQIAVHLIRGLCAASGAKIVLSSTWRLSDQWERIGPALDLPIIDRTPSLLGPRGAEIARWLADHPEVEQWAIVDDDSDMLDGQLSRFVKTSHFDGLTWEPFSRLCELLGVNTYDCNCIRVIEKNPAKLEWEA